MTNNLFEDDLAALLKAEKPDVVGATAITPSIYKAERALRIAKELHPDTVTILGGVHATFMYQQVLSEAPWIDAIVRGEGEEILIELVRAIDDGRWPAERQSIKGLAFAETGPDGPRIVATQAAPTVKDLDAINPDWGILEWDKYRYIPLNCRVAIPNMARGCPFTCSFCPQWKFWRDYRIRDPRKVVDEIETLVQRFGGERRPLAQGQDAARRRPCVRRRYSADAFRSARVRRSHTANGGPGWRNPAQPPLTGAPAPPRMPGRPQRSGPTRLPR